MKILLLAFALLSTTAYAQNEPLQPFESLGKTVKVLTLSNGKYNESFPNDSIMRIGSVLYNRNTGELVAVIPPDTLQPRTDVPSRWLSIDPLAHKFAAWSPYNFVMNNPVVMTDPDGRAPVGNDPPTLGFSVGLRFSSGGAYSTSFAVGTSYQNGNFMGGLNIAANFYNSGLGTPHGTTGQFSAQTDLIVSPSITWGNGTGNPLPLNTFNNNTSTGVTNSFQGSATVASNFVFNSDNRNQRVAYIGGKTGDVGFNFYNDILPGLGDGDDRWWTGGFSFQLAIPKEGNLALGTDTFTGIRFPKDPDTKERPIIPNNPSGGKWGTYAQPKGNQELNNGQTLLILQGMNGLNIGGAAGGKKHMYSQDFIHNNLSKNKLFHSTADGL
jgi:Bacterial toxin 23